MILTAYEFEQLQKKGYTRTDSGRNLWIFKTKKYDGKAVPLILEVSNKKNQLFGQYLKAGIKVTPEMCIEEEIA